MAKLTLMHIFALFLLLSGIFITSEADSKNILQQRKKCRATLHVGGCIHYPCDNECKAKNPGKEADGICVGSENNTYDCICLTDC
ncbi:hypothetical protein Lalb_Chr03g0043451 [Lupinus albus]|uniref:Knottin, scorpion toxin n=1 Tax=Lupinus albus TaxID=3870 RepID=A0A6A4QXK0_LUPAL|nr:hypothetical protein Lalb_Chr03g0043451 [Lupinus albus]